MALALRKNVTEYGYRTEAPAYEPEKLRRAKVDYVLAREHVVRERVAENIAKGKEFKASHVLLVTLSLAVSLTVLFLFLVSLSTYQQRKLSLEEKTRAYYSLVSENALLQNEIEKKTDFNAVYRYATEELGMAMPTRRQIIYYERPGHEYVSRSAEIPK